MTRKQAQVMVVMPHPDDAEFGAAGTIARWVKEGREVVYVVLTNGDKGTSDPNISPGTIAKIRVQEQMEAARLLGVKEVLFLHHADQSLEDTPELRKQIVRLIRVYRPETVATCDPYRQYHWHRDHKIAGQVTLDAIFPFTMDFHAYPELTIEGLQPHRVREVFFWASEDINYCSDITDTFDMKIAALLCHKSQVGQILGDALESFIRQRCSLAAEGHEFELAESFHRLEILY